MITISMIPVHPANSQLLCVFEETMRPAMFLKKLLSPTKLAVAGGSWADLVVAANRKLGFRGELIHIHPTRESTPQALYARSISALPDVPDCVVLGVSQDKTIEMMGQLSAAGVEAAVCFASGFSELQTPEGERRTRALLDAAGPVPFLGPNCYGFINYLDSVAVWPDQMAGASVDRGVTLICQSGAVAFTLMSHQRSLPIAHLISLGNQSRVKVHDLIREVAGDPRVTAIGMYIEGVPDITEFIDAVMEAREQDIPVALVKSGRTEAASRVALTHTASLSGSDDLYEALFTDLGIARCSSLAELVETLKLYHTVGPLRANAKVLVTGCSGGDMAMAADLSDGLDLDFSPIPTEKVQPLRDILGSDVSLSNPLDFQTFIWADYPKITSMFSELSTAGYDAIGFVIDHPDPAYCDISPYEKPLLSFLSGVGASDIKAAAITSLPETLPKRLRDACLLNGVAPLQGMPEALRAFHHASRTGAAWQLGRAPKVLPSAAGQNFRVFTEAEAKSILDEAGVPVPHRRIVTAENAVAAAEELGWPVVLKVSSNNILHKSDKGGVALNLRNPEQLLVALERMQDLASTFLIEEMVNDAVCEILVGANVDPQFGPVLVLGTGGTFTELLRDSAPLLFPIQSSQVEKALRSLRSWPLMNGYRGKPVGDIGALVEMIVATAAFIEVNASRLTMFEINPVLVRPDGRGVVAADAVLGMNEESSRPA